MRRGPIILIVMAAALAGCGGRGTADRAAGAAERACSPPRAHWLPQGPLDAGLSPPINRLSLDRNGAIYWNGRPASLSRVSHYLAITAGMRPEPVTFLETQMGAPCAQVERVRDEMERRLRCGAGGPCAEGIWTVWEATPIPPGTPPS